MRAAGYEPEDYEGDDVEIWPEHWPVFTLFERVRSQWAHDLNGPVGLRYEAVYPLLDRLRLAPSDWDEALDDLRTMERAALAAMREEP